MSSSGYSNTSTEVVRLVESVEQLADADQHRILRLVSLLTCVPAPVQRTTHRMLRELLDADPASVAECVDALDEVIEYLENEVLARNGPAGSFGYFAPVPESGSNVN